MVVSTLYLFGIQQLSIQSHITNPLYNYDLGVDLQAESACINDPVALNEVEKAVTNWKFGKAMGIDMIPNEILKHQQLLYSIYSFLGT